MLEFFFFANYTFCYITSTFAKTNEQINRYDSFETRHFDEGKPVVSLHAHRLFSGRACSCKKDPCLMSQPCLRTLMQTRLSANQSARTILVIL